MEGHHEDQTEEIESTSPPEPPRGLGRFDHSFIIHMISSFAVFLLAVALVEMGLRFGFALWEFNQESPADVEVAAQQLANDVRTIMLNSGGPVASRTVYPILDRNFDRAGLEIAIEPSTTTIESIEETFGFTPRGLPADFPEGTHQEASVDLRAAEVCLRCHVTAAVGDVLGTVRIREYRSATLSGWWEEVRLTITLNLIKIVVHAVILFFLLRTLMGPLLSLREAVGRLARGRGGLSVRAEVKSSDEFGELAADLNAFLERISQVVRDLRRTISRTVAVTTRMAGVTSSTQEQLGNVERALYGTIKASQQGSAPGVSPNERQKRITAALAELPELIHEVHGLKHMVHEITFLEEHLCDVADSGTDLLNRLLPGEGVEVEVEVEEEAGPG